MKKAIIFSLFSIFLLAYFLRVIFLPKFSLTFTYDQARDALVTQQILWGASTKKYFLILEPMGGIPQRYLTETIAQEDSYSKLVEEKSFGKLIVQERLNIK